jgi:hypothetical protein
MWQRAMNSGGGGGGNVYRVEINHPEVDSPTIRLTVYDANDTQIKTQDFTATDDGAQFDITFDFTVNGATHTVKVNRNGLGITKLYLNGEVDGLMSFRWYVGTPANMTYPYTSSAVFIV